MSDDKRYLRCGECRLVFVLQEDGEEFQPMVGEVTAHDQNGEQVVTDRRWLLCSVCRRQAISRGAIR